MTALIGHAVYGKRVFANYFPGQDEPKFIIGTTFPDIRNLGVVTRDQTHTHDLKLVDLQACENAFEAGYKLHSLIDDIHLRFMTERGIYDATPDLRFAIQAFKVLEDRLLYPRLKSWIEIAGYFDQILSEEVAFKIDPYDIRRWHSFIKSYFSTGPTEETTRNFNAVTGFPAERADAFLKTYQIIQSQAKSRDAILEFFDKFDQLISA